MSDGRTTLPPDLPVLTEVVGSDELPVLTEVVEADWLTAPVADKRPADVDAPHIPLELEAHLEALFMERLLPRLEAARREAIERTLAEFRQELPQLLRDAQGAPSAAD